VIGPDAPVPAPDEAARREALAEYLRANRDAYTPEALARAARAAGYADPEIEAAGEVAGETSATAAGFRPRTRASILVLALYGATFLGFAVVFLSKPSAMQYGWGFALGILGVTLGLALLLSLRTIGRSKPRASAAGDAVAALLVLPVVFLLAVVGLCVATTAPLGLFR
jgi:hypothetical protein